MSFNKPNWSNLELEQLQSYFNVTVDTSKMSHEMKNLYNQLELCNKVLKIKANDTFRHIFGYSSFMKFYPQICTEGVLVAYLNDNFYIVMDNIIRHDTHFFTQEEIDEHFDIMESL